MKSNGNKALNITQTRKTREEKQRNYLYKQRLHLFSLLIYAAKNTFAATKSFKCWLVFVKKKRKKRLHNYESFQEKRYIYCIHKWRFVFFYSCRENFDLQREREIHRSTLLRFHCYSKSNIAFNLICCMLYS